MRMELKETLKIAGVMFIPTAILALWLCNPHGSHGSEVLYFIGLFIGAPFILGAMSITHFSPTLGLVIGAIMQFGWITLWVYIVRYLSRRFISQSRP